MDLCGSYADAFISGGLEKDFIDGGSLELIAQFGGGRAFIDPDPTKLETAFLNTAPPRYRWYTYRYKFAQTPYRSPLVTQISLNKYANASAKIKWFPSPWIDGPPGSPMDALVDDGQGGQTRAEGQWTRPASIRQATGLFLLLLGFLMILTFLGPALFNGRRAITRRSRKTS